MNSLKRAFSRINEEVFSSNKSSGSNSDSDSDEQYLKHMRSHKKEMVKDIKLSNDMLSMIDEKEDISKDIEGDAQSSS